MRIAILGATSEIGKDLIYSFAVRGDHELFLFARRPKEVASWLVDADITDRCSVFDFESFKALINLDVILNFVGAGDPRKISGMGSSIVEATFKFDRMATDYLKLNPNCRYIFMSSGAAYGSNFSEPVDEDSSGSYPINHFGAQDWYGLAKMFTECQHRSLPNLNIVDVRIFNYFSRSQNINSGYFITEVLRAIQKGMVLKTSEENIVRDYLGSEDFYQLIEKILESPPINTVVDCYSKGPIDKFSLLKSLEMQYGLQYKISRPEINMEATGRKLCYYSLNRRAEIFGYKPKYISLDLILQELAARLQ